jgi:hypothetical protein
MVFYFSISLQTLHPLTHSNEHLCLKTTHSETVDSLPPEHAQRRSGARACVYLSDTDTLTTARVDSAHFVCGTIGRGVTGRTAARCGTQYTYSFAFRSGSAYTVAASAAGNEGSATGLGAGRRLGDYRRLANTGTARISACALSRLAMLCVH